MAAPPPVPDRSVLAGRIQGFGNVNPPPLEEETGATLAKKAVARLGDMVGEEVMLTVEDFREKGAVGAVKDAVADAGDILIDGVSGLISWIRGDPPVEEESEKLEDATKALSNGPSGAAYGISQASPTGGINAVWVMPEDADPAALAQLASQHGGLVSQQNDPRVPKNIQPYQPPPGKHQPAMPQMPPHMPMTLPGGPVIAPYQPAPSGPGFRPPPFLPGAGPGVLPAGRWGPGGYNPAMPGVPGASGSAASGPTGAKGMVERISKGDMLVGAEVVKRVVSQCTATKTTGKQLGEIVCERTRRLYLGLDGLDPVESDAALARLLAFTEALQQQDTDFTKSAVEEITKGVQEELLSLRGSAKHKDAAEPLLRRLGLIAGAKAAAAPEMPDLLGGGIAGGAAQEADLLGGSEPARPVVKEADLLGGDSEPAPAAASIATTDLLAGALGGASASSDVASLDPLLAAPAVPSQDAGLLAGLNLDTAPISGAPSMLVGSQTGTMSAATGMAALGKELKKDEDAFGFVGAEMSKASGKP